MVGGNGGLTLGLRRAFDAHQFGACVQLWRRQTLGGGAYSATRLGPLRRDTDVVLKRSETVGEAMVVHGRRLQCDAADYFTVCVLVEGEFGLIREKYVGRSSKVPDHKPDQAPDIPPRMPLKPPPNAPPSRRRPPKRRVAPVKRPEREKPEPLAP